MISSFSNRQIHKTPVIPISKEVPHGIRSKFGISEKEDITSNNYNVWNDMHICQTLNCASDKKATDAKVSQCPNITGHNATLNPIAKFFLPNEGEKIRYLLEMP